MAGRLATRKYGAAIFGLHGGSGCRDIGDGLDVNVALTITVGGVFGHGMLLGSAIASVAERAGIVKRPSVAYKREMARPLQYTVRVNLWLTEAMVAAIRAAMGDREREAEFIRRAIESALTKDDAK